MNPEESITLETPRDWVRHGEERAEREWMASHPARLFDAPNAEGTARSLSTVVLASWFSAVLFALIMVLVLAPLAIVPNRHDPTAHAPASRAIGPALNPMTTLTTSTARVTLTSCNDGGAVGTLTNTSGRRQDFRVLVSLERGRQDEVVSATRLLGIPPGQTVVWKSFVISVPLRASLTCSLYSVASKAVSETTPYSGGVDQP